MKLQKNVAVSEAGLLFNPVTGESFSVNPIGAEILDMLKAEQGQEHILKTMLEKYSTDKDTIEKDLQDFIGILNHHNLLENNEEART
jgi:hypothetical protein